MLSEIKFLSAFVAQAYVISAPFNSSKDGKDNYGPTTLVLILSISTCFVFPR
jgi:hypothetical protein